MTKFILAPSRYMQIPTLLKTRFPGFASSEAYLMHDGLMDDLPGVILASFANYLTALGEKPEEEEERRDALDMIDVMLGWGDGETDVSIHDAFFWALESKPRGSARALPVMSPSVRLAFEAWRAKPY